MFRYWPVQRRDEPSGYAFDDAGFSVLEVVVAMTLFIIVSASATVAVANSIRATNATRDRVTATNLAQSDLEIARAMTTRPTSTTYLRTVGSETFRVIRTVSSRTVNCPVGTVMDISVLVALPSGKTASRTDSVIAC